MAEFIQPQKYDTLAGRPVRDMRANDVVSLYFTGTLGCVGSTFGTTSQLAVASDEDFFITNIWAIATASIQLSLQHGTGNTATMCTFYLIPNTPFQINTNLDTPIGKVTSGSTLSIRAPAISTACVWLSGVRFPTWSHVETV